jgi:MoxR-like ATPase
MDYDKKRFDVEKTQPALDKLIGKSDPKLADRRDGLIYVYTDEIELTVNVALATGRPVLLRGPSGSGKSSLARNVALRLGRRYYEEVISSKSQHTDLQWHFDLLRRFRDAQTSSFGADADHSLKADADYMEPRALWWAFDRDSAARRGMVPPQAPERMASDPSSLSGDAAVVLIDEIDKADPDLPNNLLVTLGSLQFAVPELNNVKVETKPENAPLVFITSNDERDLPTAFLRRCLVLELNAPDRKRLIEIAAKHCGDSVARRKNYADVASALYDQTDGNAPSVSTAEFLDTVLACRELSVRPKKGDPVWDSIVRATVRKPTAPKEGQT